ncbi:ATP-binding protein [Pseudonocardia endophytica]|uniref:Signal transduction histidine kinase n=1 Tax=Pseudonocardia endophytica TaxID=401976 RepID=A0A4R1HX19_PSEEN|nr:ATP-binding protein [Pseudonocardia endophytica]TCK25340.1 signal transduction histidine kinase [Pseudonocardia endophytica]
MSTAERPDATLPLPNALGYGVAVVAVAGVVVQGVAVAAGRASLAGALASFDLYTMAFAAVLGALILRQRPGHVIGWTLVGIGGVDAVFGFGRLYRLYTGLGFDDDPVHFLWVLIGAGVLIALPQLFPDGRLLSRRWWPVAAYGVATTVLLAVGIALDPAEDDGTALIAVASPLYASAILAGLVPLVVRFRRSTGARRQQFKWVFYGFAVGGPPFAVAIAAGLSEAAVAVTVLLLMVAVPGAMTVAVLRYRLYDIDVVISRTLLVAGLAAFITVAYVAIVVGIGSLIGRTGAEPDLTLSLVATAAVAVAFAPVRLALQRIANRLVYGRRATPYDVLSGFATRIGAAEPSPDTLARLAGLMAGGTGAHPARVWLRVGRQLRPAATWPDRDPVDDAPAPVDTAASTRLPDADLAVPVHDRGELLGVLTIAKPRGERVTDADTDLVGRLAAAAGVVLRNLRLDAELAERLSDIEASRRRLVVAQDEARRRIEADLAGGARAHLAGLRDELADLARHADPAAAPKTAGLLTGLVGQAGGALATLDGLAAGIYPPRLAADGPAAALAEQARRAGLPVVVDADGVGRYPPDVEAAAYFCVLEALQNVAKYAGASSARVRLSDDGTSFRFAVVDDGAGFDAATTARGTGLQGMADRLDTVGGALTVSSVPGSGTTVTGEIPVEGSATPAPQRTPAGARA